jgi:hypothetical protein
MQFIVTPEMTARALAQFSQVRAGVRALRKHLHFELFEGMEARANPDAYPHAKCTVILPEVLTAFERLEDALDRAIALSEDSLAGNGAAPSPPPSPDPGPWRTKDSAIQFLRDQVDERGIGPVTTDQIRHMLAASEARPRPADLAEDWHWDALWSQLVIRRYLKDPSSVGAEEMAASYRVTVRNRQWRLDRYGYDRRAESRQQWLDLFARLAVELADREVISTTAPAALPPGGADTPTP